MPAKESTDVPIVNLSDDEEERETKRTGLAESFTPNEDRRTSTAGSRGTTPQSEEAHVTPTVVENNGVRNPPPSGPQFAPILPPVLPQVTVVEVLLPDSMWQLCRTSQFGAGPQCNACSGRESDRDECINRVKKVGFPLPVGVFGIAVRGERQF